MSTTTGESNSTTLQVGIPGLDDILNGGLQRRRLYLVRGKPGTGKTTLALQFLRCGSADGERCLYVTLSETKEELAAVAQSHGWNLDGIDLIDLSSVEGQLTPDSQSTLLHPAEVELARTVKMIESEIERSRPARVVLDSLSELRLIAQSPLRYRRQILAFKTFFAALQCTVLMIDDGSGESDGQIESIAHGVLELEHLRPEYGAERRRMSVLKMRGARFRGGYHDYLIRTGGLDVFPRLVAAEHHLEFPREHVASGISHLDELLGGGLARGTSTLFLGPAGSGKSTIALTYAVAAASRGDRVGCFLFDENLGVFRARADSVGIDLAPHLESGAITLQQVDPAELAPGQFSAIVRKMVEEDDTRMVVIDSLNGFFNAMPEENFLLIQLHEMLAYLAQRGVTTILVVAQHGLVGSHMVNPVDLTYLADTVLLLRYFEFQGRIRKAVSVVKKRSGGHEHSIRELDIGKTGVRVGDPLRDFSGVLTGTPSFTGKGDSMIRQGERDAE